MFSKHLNFDIIEKRPNTYYVIKDPDEPPYTITNDKTSAIQFILPYADAYLDQKLNLVKDPIGRHDSHNNYYSSISYDGYSHFIIHKLVEGNLEKFSYPTLDDLLEQFEKQTSMLNEYISYFMNDMFTTDQIRQMNEIVKSCTYPVFLTNNEDLIEDIIAEQQEYLENKTNYDLSIDITETNDGYSFEPIINGEIINEDSLKTIVTEDINNQLTEINHHLKHVKKAIKGGLKNIPTK